MIVTAHLPSLRIAPRKVRLMTRLLWGVDAIAAKHQLNYFAKRSSKPLAKLLDSALANAQNNFGMVKENMRVKEVIVNGGPVLKRFEPKGFGSVSPIAKRTSHVTIVLEEKVAGLKSERKVKEQRPEEASEAKPRTEPQRGSSAGAKKELGRKEGRVRAFTKKIFQRKAI